MLFTKVAIHDKSNDSNYSSTPKKSSQLSPLCHKWNGSALERSPFYGLSSSDFYRWGQRPTEWLLVANISIPHLLFALLLYLFHDWTQFSDPLVDIYETWQIKEWRDLCAEKCPNSQWPNSMKNSWKCKIANDGSNNVRSLMFDRSKPKIRCSSSITNRWTRSSLFNVRKMMFEFIRCTIKWCSIHH